MCNEREIMTQHIMFGFMVPGIDLSEGRISKAIDWVYAMTDEEFDVFADVFYAMILAREVKDRCEAGECSCPEHDHKHVS